MTTRDIVDHEDDVLSTDFDPRYESWGGDVEVSLSFDPSQPRDDHGRWTDGGGSASAPKFSRDELEDELGAPEHEGLGVKAVLEKIGVPIWAEVKGLNERAEDAYLVPVRSGDETLQYVVEGDGTVTDVESWIANANPEDYIEVPDFNADYWKYPGSLYHATTEDHADDIMRKGLEQRSETRGLTNRGTGAAVFTTSDIEQTAAGHYGDVVFEIDMGAMKRDGYMPEVAMEEAATEEMLRSALAHKIGYEDYVYEDIDPGGRDPNTVVVFGEIPPKYLKRLDQSFSLRFDPDQPRDDRGRWVDSDGGQVFMRPPTKADADRVKALRIPPAWTDVHISEDADAALQAIGTDAKGRTQYRYSAEHAALRAAEKFARVKEFHDALPGIRAAINRDIKRGVDPDTREAASVLYLIDKTGFRVGSDTDTQGDVQAYGATTLEARHVKVSGNRVEFSFTGKKGVAIEKTVEDATLARLVTARMKRRDEGPLFNASDGQVRDYLKRQGGDFLVKDFRTWHGTSQALRAMRSMPKPKTEREFKRAQREVSKRVADFLGNTPTVAKASYIDPSVWSRWQTKRK